MATDKRQIPTGEMRRVDGTAFDFRQPKPIARDIRRAEEQLLPGRGYDHCFVPAQPEAGQARFMASAYAAESGRMLKLFSDQPGVQFYSGNSLNGAVAGRDGVIYRQSAGFAFEAQDFPDAPNHPEFPSTVLRPGEVYNREIAYEFSVV